MLRKKSRYRFNTHTLSYEKVRTSWKERLIRFFSQVAMGLVFAVIFFIIIFNYFDSPKEKILKRENEQLSLQYQLLNKKIEILANSLVDLQIRDNNIYRIIFEAEPISEEVRNAGFGGINRYKKLEGYDNSELVIGTTKKIDKLAKQMYVQSKSFEDIYKMAKEKEKMLTCIPAIQPVSNKKLDRVASGFGYRIHPIYKTYKMHTGMDFSASTGTEIYATGNGVVQDIELSNRGYGNSVVISHGYGYKTLYAHLSKVSVKKGQSIKRGEVIGLVGNTGTSTAPHLHYEVIKNGNKIDPLNFYFNDLTAEEFEKMLEISSSSSQSFD